MGDFTHDLLWGMVENITQMTQILNLDNCNNSFLLSVLFQLSFPKSPFFNSLCSKIPKSQKTT